MTQKSYRIDPATKSLFKGATKLLTYDRYEKTGSTVKFIIAPPSVEVHADNIEGLDAATPAAPVLKPATLKAPIKPNANRKQTSNAS